MFKGWLLGAVAFLALDSGGAVWQHGDKLVPHMDQLDGEQLAEKLDAKEYYDFGAPGQPLTDRWLVVFHTARCLGCHELLGAAEALAEDMVAARDNHHGVGQVDCHTNPALCRRFGVEAWAVMLFESGSDEYSVAALTDTGVMKTTRAELRTALMNRDRTAVHHPLPDMRPTLGHEWPASEILAIVAVFVFGVVAGLMWFANGRANLQKLR